MPFRSRRRGAAFNARLAQPNAQLETQIRSFLKVSDHGGHGGHDLEDTLIEFVHQATQYLGTYGEMYFEIVDDDSGGTVLTGKSLEILPKGKILHFFGKFIQIVPFKDWGEGARAIFIPTKNIWHLMLPKKLGPPRRHRSLIRKLNYLSKPVPDFATKDGKMGASAQYDFMLDHDRKEIAVEYLTKKWGSIPSLRQIKGTTEYYYIIHSLQFSYSQALIREHIIVELNSIVARLGTRNTIKVEGLPLAKDIKEAMNKLQKGEIGFEQAIAAAKVS